MSILCADHVSRDFPRILDAGPRYVLPQRAAGGCLLWQVFITLFLFVLPVL